ncbi:hypothetical protein ACK3TF_005894 [Chlorella vulgaris]
MDAASERKKQPSLNQDDERNAAFQRKQVHFEGTQNAFQASNPGAASPTGVSTTKLTAAGSVYSNDLFSGSWTIEAQRMGRMDLVDSGSTPASSTAAYTPASTGYLESARKVDDLRGRLEGLEQALKEMESKAVAHLDKQLQEKVLATAAKIVSKRFLNDQELDKKLQVQILQTAMKVVKRQNAVAQAAAAAEEANPTRRLEFEQQGAAGSSTAPAADVQEAVNTAFIAQIEQGLGEVVRRLEHKVDTVASLLDQNAFELLEARLASEVVGLEVRLQAVEQAQQAQQAAAPAADSSRLLLERVAAVEAAMAEQGRAVADLLAALRTQGAATLLGAAAAEAAVPSQGPAEAAAPSPVPPPQEAAADRGEQPAHASLPAPQLLHQRKSALVKRSVLGNPSRSATAAAAASPRAALPRLTSTHAAGTAQQIAMATAREQLAKQAARGPEDADAEMPAWVTMIQVLGWTALVLLSLAAVAAGAVAVLVKEGRLSESDLESFLFK